MFDAQTSALGRHSLRQRWMAVKFAIVPSRPEKAPEHLLMFASLSAPASINANQAESRPINRFHGKKFAAPFTFIKGGLLANSQQIVAFPAIKTSKNAPFLHPSNHQRST